MPALELSIIVVSWNSSEYIRECVTTAVRRLSEEAILGEVIVVDNRSTDDTRELVASLAGPVRLLVMDENVGFGRGNNAAIAEARGRNILFLNPDTRLDEGCLTVTLAALRRLPRAGVIGCRLYNESGAQSSWYWPHTLRNDALSLSGIGPVVRRLERKWQRSPERVVGGVVGAFMLIPAKVMEKVGGFEDSIFMYGEDVDLCYRIGRAGYRVYYVPEASCYHVGDSSGQGEEPRYAKHFEGIRGFYRRHQSPLLYRLYLWLLLGTYPARRAAFALGGSRWRRRDVHERVYAHEAAQDLFGEHPTWRSVLSRPEVIAGVAAGLVLAVAAASLWPVQMALLGLFVGLYLVARAAEPRVAASRVDIFSPWVAYPTALAAYYGVGLLLPFDYVGGRIPLSQAWLYLVAFAAYFAGVWLSGTSWRAPGEPRALAGTAGFRRRAAGMVALGFASVAYLLVRYGLTEISRKYRFSAAPGWTFYMLSVLLLGAFGLVLLEMWSPRGRRAAVRVVLLGLAVVAAVLVFASRTPLFLAVAMTAIAFHYVVGRVRLSHIVLIVLVVLLAVSVVGFIRTVGNPATASWYGANVERYGLPRSAAPLAPGLLALRNGPGHLELIEKVYPSKVPYMYGRFSVMSLATLLPGHQPLPGEILRQVLFPTVSASKMGGVAPSVLGGFYVDGGVVGIALGMAFTGLTLGLAHRWLAHRMSPIALGVYAVVLSNYLLWIYGNFLTDPTVLWLILLTIALFAGSGRVKSDEALADALSPPEGHEGAA